MSCRPLADLGAGAVEPLGTPSARAMMGGATLYCDGVACAIVSGNALWFKADASTDAAWDAAGAERFTDPRRDGTLARMNDCRAPDDVYDEPDAFRRRAALAIGAGRRTAATDKKW